MLGPEDMRVLFRHGIEMASPEEVQYVLDYDCFSQTGRAFDEKKLHDQIENLHTFALQSFQATVRPDYLASLK
jgi:uncharacterized protein (TIGR04255 family)